MSRRNELIQGADARPRIHVWPPEPHEGVWTYSIGPVGKRFAGTTEADETTALAVYAMNGRIAKGCVIIVEQSANPEYGKEPS